MPATASQLPSRLPELVLSPFGNDGSYVVKNRRTGKFFMVGEVEHFLLSQLDGDQSAEQICTAFESQFGEPVSLEDLTEFLDIAARRDLVTKPGAKIQSSVNDQDPIAGQQAVAP